MKRQIFSEWIKKIKPKYMLSTCNPSYKDRSRSKVNGCKMIYHANTNERKVGVTM